MFTGYTYAYGKGYVEWVKEKARRIHKALKDFYERSIPLDVQHLISLAYLERVHRISKLGWNPVHGFLLDKRPSAFIKSFVEHLIARMVKEGYAEATYIVVSKARGESITLTTHDELEVGSLIEEEINAFISKHGEEVKPEVKTAIKREVRILKLPAIEWIESLHAYMPNGT